MVEEPETETRRGVRRGDTGRREEGKLDVQNAVQKLRTRSGRATARGPRGIVGSA
jgi:hypothetical protein